MGFKHKSSDKHLLAHQFLWAERRQLLVRESEYFQKLKGRANKSFCTRASILFRVKIRNNHPMLSIVLRNVGTNFTAHQRVISVLSSLGTCLAINAIFYGVTFKTPTTESATTIFVTIVAAVVPVLGRLFFKKNKRATHTSEKERHLQQENQ